MGLGWAKTTWSKSVCAAKMPNLNDVVGWEVVVEKKSAPFDGERATLLAIDPAVGVDGLPQSATGQAILLTGKNVSAEIGYHYGPKPNPEVAALPQRRHIVFMLCESREENHLARTHIQRAILKGSIRVNEIIHPFRWQ